MEVSRLLSWFALLAYLAGTLVAELLGLESFFVRVVVIAVILLPLFAVMEMAFVGRPLQRSIAASDSETAAREEKLVTEARRQELDGRLHRALEMADGEDDALAVITRAFGVVNATTPAELLLADSSRAHLHLVASHPEGGNPGCGVTSPHGCAAVRRGQTLVFGSGEELDACPHLRGRPGGDRAAACVPVTILGNTVGVLHATGPADRPPDTETIIGLETIANQAGARIGMIRALARSEVQAATDPLTGLLNRRSLEDAVRELTHEGHGFAVVIADLDHFKRLNDTHGHDAGDRSLRQFSTVLARSLRPGDLACRYGGEEFVLVLPDCDADGAVFVAERLREALALAQVDQGSIGFTASFGVAAGVWGDELPDLITAADGALFQAKRDGRDRVVIANSSSAAAPES